MQRNIRWVMMRRTDYPEQVNMNPFQSERLYNSTPAIEDLLRIFWRVIQVSVDD
jgi:hypothetical protein